MATVQTGLERLLGGEVASLRGRRLGLIANPTSVDRGLGHSIDRLGAAGFTLTALFGPEHGLRGDAQDMISVDAAHDARSGLPVHSLYGHDVASLSPRPASLAGLDALVFDIQDVGARYYTYAWTLVMAMQVAETVGLEVVVLDRPNPIGGRAVEGGAIEPGFESFVGHLSLPNRHGLTVGELARWAHARLGLSHPLRVVEVTGWRRGDHYDATGLPWVQPSPNMPTVDTALVYPGMCLVEATELSEGRGTTRPFEVVGAPFIDGHALAEELGSYRLPGVGFRPLTFTPTFHKHAGQACGGIQLHVTDREEFRPYATGVAFLRAVRALWPAEFRWRAKPYEFIAEVPAIDLLTGSPAIRLGLERGASVAELAASWAAAEVAFVAERAPFLLYP